MRAYVTFGSLEEGELFFARNKLHCKSETGLFQMPSIRLDRTFNAFYYTGQNGTWGFFDGPCLVQRYDATIHGDSADILRLRERQAT